MREDALLFFCWCLASFQQTMMDPSTTPVSGTPGGSKPATPSSNDSRVPLDLAALVSDGEKEAELTTDRECQPML